MANTRRPIRTVCRTAAVGAGLAAGAYATFVAVAWFRYGRTQQATGEDQNPLLDRFMPTYDVGERHEVRVAAPAEITFAAACGLDLQQSRLIRVIFKARERLLGATPDSSEQQRALVPWAKTLGWGLLAEVPRHEIVMGAATRPWEANVVFRALPPEQFAAFNEPEYVKIAWTLRVDEEDEGLSHARTETRAIATDPIARGKFRRYWALFSPGIILIGREALRLVKADAERRVHRVERERERRSIQEST